MSIAISEKTDVTELSGNDRVRKQAGLVTSSQLLKELGAIQQAFTWTLTKQQRIRGFLKHDSSGRQFDPITAVAYYRTGEFFSEGHWNEAALSIGLQFSDCADIVAACNYAWDASTRQGKLRQNFLDALIPTMRHLEIRSGIPFEIFGRSFRRRSSQTLSR